MMSSWWFLWVVFMFIFLVPPVGYGWGYRGWGAPYPSYIQRRRAEQAVASGSASQFNHQSWGWGGDVLWLILLVWMTWAISAFWWR